MESDRELEEFATKLLGPREGGRAGPLRACMGVGVPVDLRKDEGDRLLMPAASQGGPDGADPGAGTPSALGCRQNAGKRRSRRMFQFMISRWKPATWLRSTGSEKRRLSIAQSR